MYNFGSIPFFASNNNLIEKNPSGTPSCTEIPIISGAANPNAIMTATNGQWTNDPISYSYTWYVDNVYVGGEEYYFVVEKDVDKELKCVVKATNTFGFGLASTRSVLILPRD
jgi:hypothetical protein